MSAAFAVKAVAAFGQGFAVLRSPAALALAFVWSLAVWLSIAVTTWAMARAFGLPLSFPGTFTVLMFMAVGVSVPTPGAVGAFHESVRLALTSLYAADNDRAVAYAVALHALSFIPVSLATLVLVAREGLTLRRIDDITRRACPPARRPSRGAKPDEVPVLRPPAGQGGRFPREPRRRGHPPAPGMPRVRPAVHVYERIDEIPYMVVKKDGRRERFDRQKLIAGLLKACEKRPVRVARSRPSPTASRRRCRTPGEGDQHRPRSVQHVMEGLRQLDKVAYVRFASVYRQFRDIDEFMTELEGPDQIQGLTMRLRAMLLLACWLGLATSAWADASVQVGRRCTTVRSV